MPGMSNFGGLPEPYCKAENSAIVVVPAPFDLTSTWMKGADKGPAAIIEASANVELYDIETDSEVYLRGIFTDGFVEGCASAEQMLEAVERRTAEHIRNGKFVVVVGGEHSVSIGAARAHAGKYENLSVLQLDAHADLRDEYNGSKYNHACVMARIKETCPIVQVGIRSMDVSEKPAMDADCVFFAADICNRRDWIQRVAERLSQRVYVTIDLDVFDPGVMPSTGTPEPGGLGWYEVLAVLRAVCREKQVVGFDVAELCPNQINKAPDFLAAKLIYTFLSYQFERR